ncbi:MAG: ABC transporter permease [Eubacteriales bacterium]|nr:ABC transporter permease [Eubacteriales bacterium]
MKKTQRSFLNRRVLLACFIAIAAIYLIGIFIWGLAMNPNDYAVHYENKLLSPSASHLFGTDAMGRDMFKRCIKGLSNSLVIGLLAAGFSSVVALILGIASAVFGGWVDRTVKLLVDLCMGLPHLVLLILVSYMLGKGALGVTCAVAFTHWPGLTRIVRQEVLQLKSSQYVQAAYRMGKSPFQVALHHMVPHVLPAYLIGLVLLFPHAIMHEASITFLGFGLSKETPAIGVILSESMNYITTGKWWMAVFPGVMLLLAVILFDGIGETLKKLWNPMSGNE